MNTVLTVTKGNRGTLPLVGEWLKRQTRKDFRWLIVTDSQVDMPKWAEVIRQPEIKGNSFLSNMRLGLSAIEGHCLIVEDDEWIHKTFCETLLAQLETVSLTGFAPSWYYHLPGQSVLRLGNQEWCALTATGFRVEVVSSLLALVDVGKVGLDVPLWSSWLGPKRILPNEDGRGGKMIISMKGWADGVGLYHRQFNGGRDPGYRWLGEMLGFKELNMYIKN